MKKILQDLIYYLKDNLKLHQALDKLRKENRVLKAKLKRIGDITK